MLTLLYQNTDLRCSNMYSIIMYFLIILFLNMPSLALPRILLASQFEIS